jgi:phosphate transport system substrate-binding protein
LFAATSIVALGLGCHSGDTPAPATTADRLTGQVSMDGSSSISPLAAAMAESFQRAHPEVNVRLVTSGTSGGFTKLCAGEVDLAGASRPINAQEIDHCRANRIEVVELPVAFDSLSVVVNAKNTFARCLTVEELKRIWEPAAQGRITTWRQVRASFPDQALTLFGPGAESGTFDYFTLAIVGRERSSRDDYRKIDDGMVLAREIAADANALGYFAFASYASHKDALAPVAIDNGSGCILPSAETVADTSYQPLSRPLFVYISTRAAARPECRAFARSFLAPERAGDVRALGYQPLSTAALLTIGRRLDRTVTGSIFGGRGSVVGVTPDVFQDEDRIKNALVR